ncbi:unnamed protein product, partial [Pylaiella littoralis]
IYPAREACPYHHCGFISLRVVDERANRLQQCKLRVKLATIKARHQRNRRDFFCSEVINKTKTTCCSVLTHNIGSVNRACWNGYYSNGRKGIMTFLTHTM